MTTQSTTTHDFCITCGNTYTPKYKLLTNYQCTTCNKNNPNKSLSIKSIITYSNHCRSCGCPHTINQFDFADYLCPNCKPSNFLGIPLPKHKFICTHCKIENITTHHNLDKICKHCQAPNQNRHKLAYTIPLLVISYLCSYLAYLLA